MLPVFRIWRYLHSGNMYTKVSKSMRSKAYGLTTHLDSTPFSNLALPTQFCLWSILSVSCTLTTKAIQRWDGRANLGCRRESQWLEALSWRRLGYCFLSTTWVPYLKILKLRDLQDLFHPWDSIVLDYFSGTSISKDSGLCPFLLSSKFT